MLENKQEGSVDATGESQPFNPNDTARIAELEAKFEKKEMTQEVLAQARDINEFSSYLGKMETFNDSTAGNISTSRILGTIQDINLELGQAVGLIRQSGLVDGTPKIIIDKAYADISNLPADLQKLYRPLVVKYLDEARAQFASA